MNSEENVPVTFTQVAKWYNVHKYITGTNANYLKLNWRSLEMQIKCRETHITT